MAAALFVAAFASADAGGSAHDVPFGPHDVRSVFYVAKSENRNQVHYAARLDGACRPQGKQPVFAYWRRVRPTGGVFDAPLTGMGQMVYGASDDQVVDVGSNGGRIQMYVKALERLRIEVGIHKASTGCTATSLTTLRGVRVRLTHAFVQLGAMGLRVRWVDVFGRDAGGAQIRERMEP